MSASYRTSHGESCVDHFPIFPASKCCSRRHVEDFHTFEAGEPRHLARCVELKLWSRDSREKTKRNGAAIFPVRDREMCSAAICQPSWLQPCTRKDIHLTCHTVSKSAARRFSRCQWPSRRMLRSVLQGREFRLCPWSLRGCSVRSYRLICGSCRSSKCDHWDQRRCLASKRL